MTPRPRSCAPTVRRRRSRLCSRAIHSGDADSKLLAYQYLQTLPKLAEGEANKLWIIPSEFTEALKSIGEGFFAPRVTPPGK